MRELLGSASAHHERRRGDDCVVCLIEAVWISNSAGQLPQRTADACEQRIRVCTSPMREICKIAVDLDVGRPGEPQRRLVCTLLDRLQAEPQYDRFPAAIATLALDSCEANRAQLSAVSMLTAPLVDRSLHDQLCPAEAALADLAATRSSGNVDRPRFAGTIAERTSAFYAMSEPDFISPMAFVFWDRAPRAWRRLAAVALAMRVYRADHDGQWPATLGSLVPTELRAVPDDPLARSRGTSVGYVIPVDGRLDGDDGPFL